LTRAEWSVVNHPTIGRTAADTGARINTLVTNAGLVKITLRGDRTLRPAARRKAHILRQTGAGGHTVLLAALRIGTTWGGLTGIDIFPNGCKRV